MKILINFDELDMFELSDLKFRVDEQYKNRMKIINKNIKIEEKRLKV